MDEKQESGAGLPVLGAGNWEPPQEVALHSQAIKFVFALPFFLAAAYMVARLGIGHLPLVLAELFMIAVGCTVALAKSPVLTVFVFFLGSGVLGALTFSAFVMGLFGGHQ